jgi:uncharacterized protein (TIGR03086 family)
MSTISRNYTKALYGFDAVVRRVPPDCWDTDSPCEGWSARDVVTHATGVIVAVAEMARTGQMAMPQPPEVEGDPTSAWSAARDDVLAALDEPGALDRAGEFWFGTSTIDELLSFTTWDPLGHAWDLAVAAGLDPHLSDEVAEAAIPVIEARADILRSMELMGDPVEVPADASPATRFLALIGRDAP